MKTITLKLLTLALVTGLLNTACKKDEEPSAASITDVQSIADNAEAENEFEDIDNTSQLAMAENDGGLRSTTSDICAAVTITPGDGNSGTVKIDFGTGCVGKDGRTRSGVLNVTYTDRYFVAGSVITITPENYKVNNVLVEGKKTVTNVTEQGGVPKHTIVVTDGKLTYPDGKTATWTASRTREFTSGSDTPLNRFDNTYTITGSGTGVNRSGVSYTTNIDSPIIIKTECFLQKIFMPVSGKITIASANKNKSIDYSTGGGGCDRSFTVTVDGRAFEVTIQ